MTNVISYTSGIYETSARLIKHKDGSVSIRYGYVKWVGNTGYLAKKTVKITNPSQVEMVKGVFAETYMVESMGATWPMTWGELSSELGL